MAATGKTALKLFFETGDIPTQSQFADFIESYQNIVDDNLLIGNTAAITDVSPAAQGTATLLTTAFNQIITSHLTTGGVKLKPALPNMVAYLFNNGSFDSVCYPAAGENFIGYSANVPLTIKRNDVYMFVCYDESRWVAVRLTSAALTYRSYVANVVQSGTGNPGPSILRNDLGFIPVWSRTSAGIYKVTNAGLYPIGKVFTMCNSDSVNGSNFITNAGINLANANTIDIQCFDNTFAVTDNVIFNIEIRIYD